MIASQAHRSQWYQDYLVQQLRTGEPTRRETAATTLAYLGAEAPLIEALRHDRLEVREAARRALDARWFQSEGMEAAKRLVEAEVAISQERREDALITLDAVVHDHPAFAEGWNRRAGLLWRMGRVGACLQSCEHALESNGQHYGAWLGLALCHMKLGHIPEARASLQAYLSLQPFDAIAIDSLKKCDALAELEETEYRLSVAGALPPPLPPEEGSAR
ncbi:MAG: tetratricopeptide repeat protein [Verrucomicrobia bacterium]|nr:tetratricopeptide repeat protein [Verrucomicrobiota bacterium]MBI3866926.1 tetratricopeptide repeat protein [Verrucomicrobiota bacterium]